MYVQGFFVSSLKSFRGERKDCLVYCLLSEQVFFFLIMTCLYVILT